MDPFAGFATQQQPGHIGKASAKQWTSRACDRCRKRKAKCDEVVPCKNCRESGAECTHIAPVRKRGPRPRPKDTDLETRLQNLEHLLASIPGSSTAPPSLNPLAVAHPSSSADLSSALTAAELDQIWFAAETTPGSDGHGQTQGGAGPSQYYGAQLGLPPSTQTPGWAPVAGVPDLTPAAGREDWWAAGTSAGEAESSAMGAGNGGWTGLDELLGGSLGGITGKAQGLPHATPASHGPQRQDLLYRDSEGQTRYLGPSSGMPLLDRLKTSSSSPPSNPATAAEEWLSLSAAIGLDVGRTHASPLDTSPDAGMAVQHEGAEELWRRITEICPPDLIDGLVRAYFTISHLLWPILHAPTFMSTYRSPQSRNTPTFLPLLLSVMCLSCRYARDPRLADPDAAIPARLLELALQVMRDSDADLSARTDIYSVQARVNMAVVLEGTGRPSVLWRPLTRALSIALDLGLHRRAEEWDSFTAVDIEVRKRTMWAIYCQHIKASSTYGRPPMISITDLDLDEPAAVDDVCITVDGGIGIQPPDRTSLMAGFVAAVRVHMILERTIRRINRAPSFPSDPPSSPFLSLLQPSPSFPDPIQSAHAADLALLPHVTDSLPGGDWTFSPQTILDPDNVRFFQKTRVFALQQFVRLLIARHRFGLALEEDGEAQVGADAGGMAERVRDVTQSALGIIGAYNAIDSRGRLGFFGAHAIAQLTQAGAGLIGVLLHLRATPQAAGERDYQLAMQGLPACVQVLSRLGKRRPAGLRSAQLLAEFARACKIPMFTLGGGSSPEDAGQEGVSADAAGAVVVPMLRSLPRRESGMTATPLGNGSVGEGGFEGMMKGYEGWMNWGGSGANGASSWAQ